MQKRITDYDVKDLIKLAVGAAPGLSSPAPWKASPASSTAGPIKPLGAAKPPNVSVPGAFMSGMWQGAKNELGAIGNFAKGTANFIGGGLGTLTAASPHADINQTAPHALKTMGAGARDMTESLGQFVGLNNAFDKNWNYTGAKAPQNVNQQQQAFQQHFFSKPQDKDLALLHQGLNNASNAAAETIPLALAGPAALAGASKVPVLANAGNAIRTAITGNRFLNPVLQTAGVATGMPLHPAVLPGGRLAGAANASQMAQYLAPSLVPGVAGAQPYFPAVAADSLLRDNIHERAPELLDAAFMPSSAVTNAPIEAAAHTLLPSTEYAEQQQQQQQQLAQQQAAEAREYQYQEQMQQAQTLANAHETYGGALASAVARGGDEHFNARISNLTAKNAPPEEINRAYDEYLQHVSKNMSVPEYEQLRHTVDQARPTPQLTGPEATQPNPQGPSTAQQPPASAPAPEPAPGQPAAAQSVATPVSTPVSTHVGTADQTFEPELVTQMQNAQTPEEKQVVQQAAAGKVKQIVDNDPVGAQGVKDLQTGKTDTAEAKKVQARIDTAESQRTAEELENLKKAHPEADISDPKTYGIFLSQAAEKAKSLPFEHKLLMGLGLGGGLIGILSSLFGDTGMAGGLLGVLGLAVGGAAGAAGGVFGNQAQAAAGKMMGDVGNFFGQIPDEARDANNFRPGSAASKAFEAKLQNTFLSGDAAAAQKMVDDRTAQFEPLERAYATSPSLAHTYLMGTENPPKTPEEAEALYQHMARQAAQARALSKNTTAARGAINDAGTAVTDAYNSVGTAATNAVNSVGDWWNTKTNGHILKSKEGASMNIAQQIFFKQAALKAARCWAGYEPVPGKAPYSDNSCRPKRKKKTEKKAEQQYSNKPFNPAIGYKHPDPKASLEQQYRRQMYLSGKEVADRIKNPQLPESYDYSRAKQHYGVDANGTILMPRAPGESVSPGQIAAPVAPAVAPVPPPLAQPAVKLPVNPAVKLPVNPGPRNPAPAFKGRIKPPAPVAPTAYKMGPPAGPSTPMQAPVQ